MDALALIPEHAKSDPFWVGGLSMALALTLKGDKHIGKHTLDEFMRAPVSVNLRAQLREELKK